MGTLSLGGEVRIGAIVVHGPESPTRELTGTTAEVDAREESLSQHQVRGRESLPAADEGLPVAGGDFGRVRICGHALVDTRAAAKQATIDVGCARPCIWIEVADLPCPNQKFVCIAAEVVPFQEHAVGLHPAAVGVKLDRNTANDGKAWPRNGVV